MEAGCERDCPKVIIPENKNCYEKMTLDECGCDVAPPKKPCVVLPVGQCKKGTAPCTTTDACDCSHKSCCPCKEFDPNSCNDCERPHYHSPTQNCQSGTCIPKKCPSLKNKRCGPCEEKVIGEDACGCATASCVKKLCRPPLPCKSGELTTTSLDACGCKVVKCGSKCPKDKSCVEEKCYNECQECPKDIAPDSDEVQDD